jgi:steroid delta-isomerase-like uncharacterized protein
MNRDVITALFDRRADAWARHDADALAATHAVNAIGDSPMQGRLDGRTRIRDVYADWFGAFRDLTFTRKQLLIDGPHAAELFALRGTQSAPFHGVPATARRIDIHGALFYTIGPDGLISEDRRVYDVTRMLVQLGLLKAKPAPGDGAREADRAH